MTFLPDNALPAIAASLAAAIAACIGLTASASKAAWIERRSAGRWIRKSETQYDDNCESLDDCEI